MIHEYGIYEQGAMFTREDFDPFKTINYLFESYGIKLPEEVKQEIKGNKLSDENFDFICKELEVEPADRTLQNIVVAALGSLILYEIVIEDSENFYFQNDTVYAAYYADVVGEFMFDNENKPHESVDGDCLMVCFHVPYVWDMKDVDIPADKYMASLRIKDAVKNFLKDDIDWEQRLGCLYASGYNS